jgi:hypothetical protein
MAKLALEVEPKKWFRLHTDPRRYFEGAREGETFRVQRILNYTRNAFLPRLDISATPAAAGALIHVKMRTGGGILTTITLFSLPFLAMTPLVAQDAPEALWLTLGIPGFLLALGLVLFNVEASRQEKKLLELFSAGG